jgi:hypothetical protein
MSGTVVVFNVAGQRKGDTPGVSKNRYETFIKMLLTLKVTRQRKGDTPPSEECPHECQEFISLGAAVV